MKKLILTLAGLSLALTACAGQSAPVAVESPEPVKASVSAPKPVETPEAVKPKPKPVETAKPAPVVSTQAVPAPVYVAPENYATDAPEWVDPAPVTNPAPVQNVPVPAQTFEPHIYAEDVDPATLGYSQDPITGAWLSPDYVDTPSEAAPLDEGVEYPQEFVEPTPPGIPAELLQPTCDTAGGYVYDYTSAGCLYVGDANLGQGMGGNYDAPCDGPGQVTCAEFAKQNGF